MIKASKFFGGSKKVDLAAAASQRIHPEIARWWSINATGAGAFVILPDAHGELASTRLGFSQLIVAAVGANSVVIEDANGDSQGTVAAGSVAIVSLTNKEDASGYGRWYVAMKAHA